MTTISIYLDAPSGSAMRTAFADAANLIFPDGWPTEVNRAWNELNTVAQPKPPVDPTTLTYAELASCADEYIRRTVVSARQSFNDASITVLLYASQYKWNTDELEISHKLHIDPTNSEEIKLAGSNLEQLLAKHRAIAGIPVDPPKTYTPALPAPTPPADATPLYEEAEFTPVSPQASEDLHDDVPL